MVPQEFSKWIHWKNRSGLELIESPGIYAIAISDEDIEDKEFTWTENIVYFGMSNARGGLKSRLNQFDRTINGGHGHGGAARVRFKHKRYLALVKKLYVSIHPIECSVISNLPGDLLKMGEIAKLEFECLAEFAKQHNRLPEFNDKARSPKK